MYSRRGSATETLVSEMSRWASGKPIIRLQGLRIQATTTVAPIFRLPPEILCEIFSQEGDRNPLTFTVHQSLTTREHEALALDPVILSHVCSQWRTLALGLPTLWSRITVSKTTWAEVHRTATWLRRTKGVPLSIEVRLFDTSPTFDNTFAISLLNELVSYSSTWSAVNFILGYTLLSPLLHLFSSATSPNLLQIADLHVKPRPQTDLAFMQRQIDDAWVYLHSSLRLRHVVWRQAVDQPLPFQPPLSRLEGITFGNRINLDDLLQLLPQLTRIQSLVVMQVFPPGRIVGSRAQCTSLPNLKNLTIRTHSSLDHFLTMISTPSLVNIALAGLGYTHPCTMTALLEFIQRSGCVVEGLSFRSTQPDDGYIHLLSAKQLQKLSTLCLGFDDIPDGVVHALSRRRADGVLNIVPCLTDLTLASCIRTDGLISTLILSRWHVALADTPVSANCMTSISIYCSAGLGPKDTAFLAQHPCKGIILL